MKIIFTSLFLALFTTPIAQASNKKGTECSKLRLKDHVRASQMGRLFAILDKGNRQELWDQKVSHLGLFALPQLGNRCAGELRRRYLEISNSQDKMDFIKRNLPIFKDGNLARDQACEKFDRGINKYTKEKYQNFLLEVLKCPKSIDEIRKKPVAHHNEPIIEPNRVESNKESKSSKEDESEAVGVDNFEPDNDNQSVEKDFGANSQDKDHVQPDLASVEATQEQVSNPISETHQSPSNATIHRRQIPNYIPYQGPRDLKDLLEPEYEHLQGSGDELEDEQGNEDNVSDHYLFKSHYIYPDEGYVEAMVEHYREKFLQSYNPY